MEHRNSAIWFFHVTRTQVLHQPGIQGRSRFIVASEYCGPPLGIRGDGDIPTRAVITTNTLGGRLGQRGPRGA
jgi:hypothetical protein